MPRDDYDDGDDDFGYGKPDRPEPETCPACGCRRSKKVSFTWWGGAVGPALFSQVRCAECGQNFNRKTGKPIGALVITLYSLVVTVIAVALLFVVFRVLN
jgi:transposase-like protein